MQVTKRKFLGILRRYNIPRIHLQKIADKNDSPLAWAFKLKGAMPQANDLEHSYRIFGILSGLMKRYENNSHNSVVELNKVDYLILFYASLLHDSSKSTDSAIMQEIKELKQDNHKRKDSIFSKFEKCCRYTSDHAVESAHYLELKRRQRKIRFYGLDNNGIRCLLNIIAFHAVGSIHSCFLPKEKLSCKEIFMCLAFWIADVADGTSERVLAATLVSSKARSQKAKARLGIEKVSVNRDLILWEAKRQTPEVKKASSLSNSELTKHRALIQAFGLPSKIVCPRKTGKMCDDEPGLDINDIFLSNLTLQPSDKRAPLLLSSDTLPGLYEKIVEASSHLRVVGSLSHLNHFGPVVLEVKNVEKDKAEEVKIRSEVNRDIAQIKKYTQIWLDPKQGAEKDFHFGYTHGQRIWRYLYPRYKKDLDQKEFQNWQGSISQFRNVVRILKKEGRDARRAYVIIPNPIIDTIGSYFFHKEEMSPALLAIHFMIDGNNKLSGFGLLRAQELSTFFVVNYFEIKSLIDRLSKNLKKKYPKIRPGRIVMMSAFGYFDPNSVLLDKAGICKKTKSDIETYAQELMNSSYNQEFIQLLNDFADKDYIRIETSWCKFFKGALPRNKKLDRVREGIVKLKRNLDKLEEKRIGEGYTVTHPKIKQGKRKAVKRFIEIALEAIG